MGAHIMERSLLLFCLLALVIPANSLKCHSCIGDHDECKTTEVTCPGKNDKCSTSAMFLDSFPCKAQNVFKSCINSTSPSQKLSVSPSELVTLSLQQEMCDSDLCNTQKISDPDTNLNDLYCYSCISPGTNCNSAKMAQLQCKGGQNQCMDMRVIGSFGDIADVNMKGCGQIPSCTQNMVFSSQTSSVSVQCCNGNYCNSDTDYKSEDKTPNGIQCYSCNTLDGTSCSPKEVVKAQCYGTLTSCLEVAGISMKGGQPMPNIIKGCATPSMCDSSILPLLQKLGSATVKCCNGSLCNNQFSESGLRTSGYLPIGKSSPETGIKNTHSGGPSRNHKYYDSSVKTGHHGTKYGTGSMSPSSGYNSNCNDVNIFSAVNSPNMSPGNNNGEGVKGGSWNSNSHAGYPNPSAGNNISSSGNNTTGSGNTSSAGSAGIFTENESHNVSSPFNNSSGKYNLSVLSPGGPALSGESVSDTPNYNSNDNSVLGVPTSFPDFTNYDSNIFPNSYYDSMNYPNNEDFSSYEGAGFTEVVYSDIDSNEDQFNSPTVAPNSIINNSNDSTGNSGSHNNTYNPNGILSANNSATSGHSVNIDSNVNRQENNGTIQNLTSTTPKTHNSISEYGTYIDNMGISSNNTSGNNISSSENNTAGSGNTSSTGTVGIFPGSESHNISVSDNYSNSNSSPIPDVNPTFADFTSYVDNSFPNSYNENDMNNPNNNDFNSYENAGFTEIMYADIDFIDDQSNSFTVAPDISNTSDSIGNSGSDNNSYNQDIDLPANNYETSGYPADTVNIGSNTNASGNNGSIQNYNINQQISGYGTNIYNTGNAYSNCSGNNSSSSGNNTGSAGIFSKSESHNVSSPINDSSGEDNLNTLSCGGSVLGGEGVSDTSNYNSDDNSIPDEPPTFPYVPYYIDNNNVPNSYYDNNINYPNNGFNSYESPGFNEVGYADIDVDENQSSSSTVAPDGIVYNSYDSIDNSWSDNNAYNPDIILSPNNNENNGHSADTVNVGSNVNRQGHNGSIQHLTPATSKTHNSGIKQHISGYGNNNHNAGIANNNGSGNYISSSGNNTTGSGNTYSTGTSGSSSYSGHNNMPGGNESSTTYISSGNGTGMTNGWNNNNNSSNHNTAVPLGYGNIPGSNHSSPSYGSSGNGTRVTNEWINSNDSSHNMAIPLGYNNIPGNNHSSMIYTGNGTGISNGWNNSSSVNPNMSVLGGYANISKSNDSYTSYTNGSNDSSTSHTSSGNGTRTSNLTNGNDSSHNMAMPVGYNNMPGNDNSSTSYTGNGAGITKEWINSNDSSHNMATAVGYNNVPQSNHSSTSYTGNGSGMTNEWINGNHTSHNMTTPLGHNNMPGNNRSSTSFTGNGTGMSNEWSNGNSFNPNMSVPGGYANIPGSNYSSTSYTSSGSGTGLTNEWINNNNSYPNMEAPGGNYGSFNRNDSNYMLNSTFSSIEDYLNHMFPGGNNYGPNFGNETANNYGPNMVPNNNNNGSSSNHNDIQNFFSTVNGYFHDGGKNITELIHNNSFISSLMPPGMNLNGSGPSGYNNINSIFNGSLSDYFKSLGNSWNKSIHNIPSIFSGGNNGPFNISNFGSGLSNIMFNPNLMNPHENHGGSSYGSNNGGTGLNGQQNNNTNDMSSGGYHDGSINGHGHNSYAVPPGGNNNGAGNSGTSFGSANADGNNYNINLMGHGLNGSMLGNGSNLHSIWSNSHIPNELIPGRSSNDSAGGGAGNSTGGGGFMFNGAPTLWTKSGSFVIFSAIALLVLN